MLGNEGDGLVWERGLSEEVAFCLDEPSCGDQEEGHSRQKDKPVKGPERTGTEQGLTSRRPKGSMMLVVAVVKRSAKPGT